MRTYFHVKAGRLHEVEEALLVDGAKPSRAHLLPREDGAPR